MTKKKRPELLIQCFRALQVLGNLYSSWSNFAKASAAIDRFVVAGLERHSCLATARGTNGCEELSGAGCANGRANTGLFPGVPALWTAFGLVLIALLSEELLLCSSENEDLPAVLTGDLLI